MLQLKFTSHVKFITRVYIPLSIVEPCDYLSILNQRITGTLLVRMPGGRIIYCSNRTNVPAVNISISLLTAGCIKDEHCLPYVLRNSSCYCEAAGFSGVCANAKFIHFYCDYAQRWQLYMTVRSAPCGHGCYISLDEFWGRGCGCCQLEESGDFVTTVKIIGKQVWSRITVRELWELLC